MTEIKAIVYDAVGTLIHVTPSVAEIYVQFGRQFGSKLDVAEVRRRFPIAFARQERIDQEAGWRTDEAREKQRWREIVAEVLDDAANPKECFELLWSTFSKTEAWTCELQAAQVISTFQERGLRQAVASNFDGRLRGLLDHLPALRCLAPIVISSEVGWRKPAPEFFDHLVKSLNCRPGEILFVGDDRANDYDAARRAGMRAVLFDPARKHVDVDERVERLGQMPPRVV
jgi:putative hydrolase of the HAD superfamily